MYNSISMLYFSLKLSEFYTRRDVKEQNGFIKVSLGQWIPLKLHKTSQTTEKKPVSSLNNDDKTNNSDLLCIIMLDFLLPIYFLKLFSSWIFLETQS